ncbi:MAG: hypothetical protein ACYTFW_16930 [Planctomycetota bacterium]
MVITWWRKRKARIAYREKLERMNDRQLAREFIRSFEIVDTLVAYEQEWRRVKMEDGK